MFNRNILAISVSASIAIFGFSGCAQKSIVSHKETILDASQKANFVQYSVKSGEGIDQFFDILRKDGYNIVNTVPDIDKLKFKSDLKNITLKDGIDYIEREYKRRFKLDYQSNTMVYFQEIKSAKKNDEQYINLKKNGEYVDKLIGYRDINKKMNIKGEYTYQDMFYLLSKEGYQIHFKLYGAEKAADLGKKTVTNYNGTVYTFLKDFALNNKLFIDVDQKTNSIYLIDMLTKHYDLKLQPIQISTSEGFQGMMSDAVNPFGDLETELKTLIEGHGKININKTNGTLTVYGDEYALAMSDNVVEEFNAIYGKSIKIELHVFEVELKDDQSFGLDLSNFVSEFGDYATKFNAGMTSNISSVNTNSFLIQDLKTKDNINETLFKFLNKYGNTRVVTKPILETVNNLPVSMSIVTEKDYIKKIEETASGGYTTGTTVSSSTKTVNIEPATAKSGFELSVFPKIEEGGKIKIVMKPKLSSEPIFEDYDYSTEQTDTKGNITKDKRVVKLVQQSIKNISQIITVKDNELAVIYGYIYEKENFDKNTMPGVGSGDSYLDNVLSSKTNTKTKTELIFTLRASVIDD
jgi:PII-like signaling protein